MATLNPRRLLLSALLLATASGGCALAYQVMMIRSLAPVVGGTVLSLTATTTSYLVGLAAGSYLIGRQADRRAWSWRAYAILEATISICLLVWLAARPLISNLVLLFDHPTDITHLVFRTLLAGCSILPATFLMGGTLPVLARCLPRGSLGVAVNRLYAANVMGACLGCLLAGWWGMAAIGIWGCGLFAVSVNLLAASGAFYLSRQQRPPAADSSRHDNSPSIERWHLFVACFAGAGFFSAEIAWTRAVVNVASSNTLVVATVIAGALLGIALGSLLLSTRWLSGKSPRSLLGPVLLISGLALALSVVAFGGLAAATANSVNSGLHGEHGPPIALLLAGFGVLVTIFATVLSLVFPALLQRHATESASVAGTAGLLLAVNTAGAVAGIWLTSLAALPALGASGVLFLLAAVYFAVSVPLLPGHFWKVVASLAFMTTAGFVGTSAGPSQGIWIHAGMTHYRWVAPGEILYYSHDREATIVACRIDSHVALTVNGLIVAETSRPDMWDLLLKAHIPLLLHDRPDRVVLVGLGAGVSLGATVSHKRVRHIDCVELSPAVIEAADSFRPWNDNPTADPRVHIEVADGRHFLASSASVYDLIIVDPVDPPVCNLYTREFYRIARAALADKGLMVQWIPLFRLDQSQFRSLIATFLDVFPTTSLWHDGTSILLIGTAQSSLPIDATEFTRAASQPAVVASLRRVGSPSAALLLSTYICGPVVLQRFTEGARLATDDHPWLEYRALIDGPGGRTSQADNLATVLDLAVPTERYLSNRDSPLENNVRLLRPLLLELGQIRLKQLRGEPAAAEAALQDLLDNGRLQPADLELLAPFHGNDR